MFNFRSLVVVAACASMTLSHLVAFAAAGDRILPQGTRIYLVTDKEVTSKRGESDVGTVVPCRVWRDVEYEGTVFIKGGTGAACRVDKVKRRNMGGKEGEISIGGVETRSIDGQQVMLMGGYNKEGSGRKAVVWTVGLLLLWPVLFVPGGQAELPPGTVFDVTSVNDLRVRGEPAGGSTPQRINLASFAGALSAEVMLDDLMAQQKPETLRVKLSKEPPLPTTLVVDNVNGKSIEPIPVTVTGVARGPDDTTTGVGEIKLKPLAKHFQKGINRFEISHLDGEDRKATEVILDVQM
jgi:hypothetical protein